jgi:uncharacterized protein YrrD
MAQKAVKSVLKLDKYVKINKTTRHLNADLLRLSLLSSFFSSLLLVQIQTSVKNIARHLTQHSEKRGKLMLTE